MSQVLFFIQAKVCRDPWDPWLKEFRAGKQEWWCTESWCWSIKPEYLNVVRDAYVQWRAGREALSVVYPPGIIVARLEFLRLFEPEAGKWLRYGKVYVQAASEEDGYVTFNADRRIVIRGGRGSSYYGRCHVCGEYKYISQYPFYTLADGYFERPIYVPWPKSGLVVNEELYSRIDRKKWKGIDVFELPIVDEPRDGIDELPRDLVIGDNG